MEFWEKRKDTHSVPSEEQMKIYSNNPDKSPWKIWLRENADENIWKGCSGTCAFLKSSDKKLVNIPIKDAKGQPGGDHRLFDCMNSNKEMCDADRHISIIRDHVHYTKEIVGMAAKAVAEIGMFKFVAVHLRRNDFQYRQAGRAGAEAGKSKALPQGVREFVPVLKQLKDELKPNESVYIATDELDENYLAEFRSKLVGHKVYSAANFTDFFHVKGIGDSKDWRKLGLVEQVVCVGSRFFFSMPSSTYSANIMHMR